MRGAVGNQFARPLPAPEELSQPHCWQPVSHCVSGPASTGGGGGGRLEGTWRTGKQWQRVTRSGYTVCGVEEYTLAFQTEVLCGVLKSGCLGRRGSESGTR